MGKSSEHQTVESELSDAFLPVNLLMILAAQIESGHVRLVVGWTGT